MIFSSVRSCLAVGFLALFSIDAHAQLQVAAVRGRVADAQGRPAAATVTLTDPQGTRVASTESSSDGTFAFDDVAPGAYDIQVEINGALALVRPLTIRGSLPVELTLSAVPTARENVVVRGDAGSHPVENPATIAGDALRRTPEALPSQRVQAALGALPGWSAEDNGLLHVRGVDDGLLFVQDGIPVYERVDRLFGLPPDAAAVSSLNVMDGYVPPEFGYKAGAVVVVRSKSGTGAPWSATFDTGFADLDTRHVQGVASGSLGSSVGLMVTGADERSDRFLDPVDPDNLHNDGRASTAATQLTWSRNAGLLTASGAVGANDYEVPNNPEQEEAGQHQRQRTSQALFSASWQQVLSDRTVWQVSAYRRHGTASLLPSAFDMPITASASRRDDRMGLLWSVSHQRNRHSFKFGSEASWLTLKEDFSFAVTDEDEAEEADLSDEALEHTTDNPFLFSGRERPWLFSLFVQDAYRATDRLTLNFGARLDRSRMLVDTWHFGPRVGAAFVVREGTIVRGSVMRLFQPPQAEYLLLSSSEEARALSPFLDDEAIGGGTSIPAERQTSFDGSITQDLPRGWRLEGTGWFRRGKDVDDPNVFFGSTVIFPNSIARQHASGFDVSLSLRPRQGLSGSVSYTYARVEQFGPVTGGVFLEDEVAVIQDGRKFIPDHDQRHGVFATASYVHAPSGVRVSGAFRYQTGTPLGLEDDPDELDELLERPGAETIDPASGRVRPRAVADIQAEWSAYRGKRADLAVTFWITNLTNEFYAFNFGNPFSGTHFGAPRRVGMSVRVGVN